MTLGARGATPDTPGRNATRYCQSRTRATVNNRPPAPSARPRPQRARDQIPPGGVFAAPRARRHPVVHAAIAVRAGILEMIVAPRLRAPAPGAEAHRIHH